MGARAGHEEEVCLSNKGSRANKSDLQATIKCRLHAVAAVSILRSAISILRSRTRVHTSLGQAVSLLYMCFRAYLREPVIVAPYDVGGVAGPAWGQKEGAAWGHKVGQRGAPPPSVILQPPLSLPAYACSITRLNASIIHTHFRGRARMRRGYILPPACLCMCA